MLLFSRWKLAGLDQDEPPEVQGKAEAGKEHSESVDQSTVPTMTRAAHRTESATAASITTPLLNQEAALQSGLGCMGNTAATQQHATIDRIEGHHVPSTEYGGHTGILMRIKTKRTFHSP
ncbi:hypothetical protein VTN77DRAFT_2029 [Rasamsonia byssochlamydoides]|uniref:uncharacterized protein n=1 Tax=Rasamsonia byssochlamydoides TaxID=89139 RepID=UPI0037446652